MSELLVYKASAGSGKTFTLAVEYIKLLILNPRAYRQILAVMTLWIFVPIFSNTKEESPSFTS